MVTSRPSATLCTTCLMEPATELIRPWPHLSFGMSADIHVVHPVLQATMLPTQVSDTAPWPLNCFDSFVGVTSSRPPGRARRFVLLTGHLRHCHCPGPSATKPTTELASIYAATKVKCTLDRACAHGSLLVFHRAPGGLGLLTNSMSRSDTAGPYLDIHRSNPHTLEASRPQVNP